MGESKHTAKVKTNTVTASPEWIATDICACLYAAKTTDDRRAVVVMLTDYLRRLAIAEEFDARAKAIEEAASNAVPMMQMAWKQYGVGGMFECMDALRAALAMPSSVGVRVEDQQSGKAVDLLPGALAAAEDGYKREQELEGKLAAAMGAVKTMRDELDYCAWCFECFGVGHCSRLEAQRIRRVLATTLPGGAQ